MTNTGLEATVAFLRRPEAFREARNEMPRSVTAIETHLSWVFLTDAYAYKLKKPVRTESLDFSTVDLRRSNCEEEVRLNRRLAPGVYLGVVTLTRERDGTLAVEGRGRPVDSLVQMRRLPAEYMLDAVIARGRATAEEAHIRAAAHHLATFYLKARPEPLSGPAHRTLLESNVRHDLLELSHARYRLPRKRVALLADAQLTFLEACAALFERRIVSNRVVDGHGDLRPEHICVHPVPAIIDCLEFAKELRVLDPAAELAFLALECERLGDPQVGQWFLKTYTDVTGDRPPAPLLHFYRVQSALRRATIAAWHVDDPTVREPEWFRARARRYLELVEPVAIDPTCSS